MRKLCIVIPIAFLFAATFMAEDRAQAAEQYPVKPINFVVPNEPGSDADILARPLCQRVSAILGQPVIIVNKPGGGSSIGYREVFNSKPDGYTIGYGHATIIINKLMGILPFDHEGLTMICTVSTNSPILVASTKTQRPFKTIQEVISFAKSHPGEVSIATSGVGQSWWVATVAFEEGVGAKFNIIPQPGTGAFAIAQAAGGHTDLAVLAFPAGRPQIDAGNVRFIAYLGDQKFSGYENVPILKEAGYDVYWESTQIVLGPPKMGKEVTQKLVKAFETAANDPEYKKFLTEKGTFSFYLPPDRAVQFFNERRKVARQVMDKAGILKEK